MEDPLGASRDRGSCGLLRAPGMCEYDPIIRGYQGRSDFSLFRWVKPTSILNSWTIIEYAPRGLRSSERIEEEGRGGKTRLANVNFRSQRIRPKNSEALQRTGHEKDLFGILIKMFL